MKTIYKSLLFIIISIMSITSYAQDLITKRDGSEIQAKVLEVTPTEVKFKRFDNQGGPLFTLPKTEIFMIKYENGTKDVFDQASTQTNSQPNLTAILPQQSPNNTNLCMQAEQDANRYYEGKQSGKGWTCATAIITSPLIALIPAAICSGIEPSDSKLLYPSSDLMKDMNYNRCYKEQAHKIKRRKVWTSFGIGSGVWLAIILIASA